MEEEVNDEEWYIVAVLGTLLSAISLISNILIARVLLQRKYSQFFFLGVLAVSDVFLSFCYFPVVAMDVVRYTIGLWLVKLWWVYIGPVLALCYVSMTFSCFLIILGTIERYLITVKSQYLGCFRRSRLRFAIIMLCLAILLRGTAVFEVTVVKNGKCEGVIEYEPALTEFAQGWLYGSIFKFYIRTITTVFMPFWSTFEHKVKARSATRLLVFIVFSYLIANALNLLISSWEFIDFNSVNDFYAIYELMADLVSVFYVLTCATRLLVYILCNEEIRSALYDYLCGFRRKSSNASEHEYKPVQKLHYDGSIRHKSMAVGTDFDKIALALVLSQRAHDLRQNFLTPALTTNNDGALHQNGSIKSADEEEVPKKDVDADNNSFIIANPLANVSAPATPSTERKASPSNSSYNLMVKVAPC
ncbi:G-PROTEIN-RECEP-F1-2 domain-containing protein [Aphelenchoides bicaudatus]|nr:G-PROTEIN-RECEP-F1-2 domain-containing protein [Aphelenchoides bicaudatus]